MSDSVTPDILNSNILIIPDIPEIPYIPDIPSIPKVPDIPDNPFYYHVKSGCPSSKVGQVIAIFIKCAKFVPEEEKEKEEKDILPL